LSVVFPSIAVTRAALLSKSGSLMAGGVEVLDTSLWGKASRLPLVEILSLRRFRYSALYVMAGMDDTKVYRIAPFLFSIWENHYMCCQPKAAPLYSQQERPGGLPYGIGSSPTSSAGIRSIPDGGLTVLSGYY
jgi:hypothetical protein